MTNRGATRLTLLTAVVATSVAYLIFSAVSLVASATVSSASTAPDGSFHELDLGDGDFVFNWDFVESGDDSIDNVDWGMRFIFTGSYVTTHYVKDKLDGANNNPAIGIPLDALWRGAIHAKLNDGPNQTGSEWDSDTGIKNHVSCSWNWGHMRVYARSDEGHNYNSTLGNYVVASIHKDYELEPLCNNKYQSYESDEASWLLRIDYTALSRPPYNWNTSESFNFRNGSGGQILYLGDVSHKYHSDGWGTRVRVPRWPGGGDNDKWDHIPVKYEPGIVSLCGGRDCSFGSLATAASLFYSCDR